jgi:glycerol-3-phosphate acyltransferase PlsY
MRLAVLALAYLAGSVPFGLLAGRLAGRDVRAAGSGNIGATNAARVLGKGWGALVLVLDAAKGFLPALLAARTLAPWLAAAAGLLAVLGHVLPVWLRFRGGKGVATGFGVFLALAPWAAGAAGLVYLVVIALTRRSSAGSLAAVTALPLAVWLTRAPPATLALAAVVWLIIVLRHRENLGRLRAGTEGRL